MVCSSSSASRFLSGTAILIATLVVSSCSNFLPIQKGAFGTVKGQYSTAEYRYISQRKRAQNDGDQDIVCSEPSPDIAKAFSTAVSANVSHATGSEGVSFAQSQAIAQLGKRYATVELLRDLRFRDCEDYANGIIDRVEYGYRLSRYSGLVVTLLGIEMVSGDNATSPPAVDSPPLGAPSGGPGGTDSTGDAGKTKTDTPPDPAAADSGATDTLKTGATKAMQPVDGAVKTASDAYDKVSTKPSASDKAAVAALGDAVAAIKKNGDELDKAWAALSKSTGKPDAATTALLKTATTDNKDLQTKLTAADAKCKTASSQVQGACKSADSSAKTLSSALKALNDLSTALGKVKSQSTPPGTPSPGTPTLTYRTISDVQASMIAQMQQAYLNFDTSDIEKIPCADAESELTLRPKSEKLTAFQVFCLFKDNVPLDLDTSAAVKPEKSSAPAAAQGKASSDAYEIQPVNTPGSQQAVSSLLGIPGKAQRDEGLTNEKAGYAALEQFNYPLAASEFKNADTNYPNLGVAWELYKLLKPLDATPDKTKECDALNIILAPLSNRLPKSTAAAIHSRVTKLGCN